jgi:hypothetical protein
MGILDTFHKIYHKIYDIVYYIFSVKPDSYTPMKNYRIIHMIFSLAIFVFIFENIIIMIIQAILNKLKKKIILPIIPVSQITFVIHSIFLIMAFPMQIILLIKPFSTILFGFFYSILMSYAFYKTIINVVIKHFTGATINL